MILDAAPGGAAANSYCTVQQALGLLSYPLDAEVASPEVQSRLGDALIWATRLINEQVDWYGSPVTSTQALPWPQAGVTSLGQVLPLTAIPVFLQQATAEYAVILIKETLRRDALAEQAAGLAGLTRLAIDDVRIEVAADLQAQLDTIPAAIHLPPLIRRQLRPYGAVAGDGAVRLERT